MNVGWVGLWCVVRRALVTAVRQVFASRGIPSPRLMRGLLVWAILCMCCTVPATVMAARSDVNATVAYLRAADAFARAQTANVSVSVAAMEREASGIATGCPSVLVGAPKGDQLSALGTEVASSVLFSSVVPDRKAMLAFAGKIGTLHWSNQMVAKLMRAVVTEERVTAKLVMPDVCADLNEWRASGYSTLSMSTTGFLRDTDAIGKETRGTGGKKESLEEVVLRGLRPYETSGDRRLAKQVTRLNETAAKRLLSAYVAVISPVGQALGLKTS